MGAKFVLLLLLSSVQLKAFSKSYITKEIQVDLKLNQKCLLTENECETFYANEAFENYQKIIQQRTQETRSLAGQSISGTDIEFDCLNHLLSADLIIPLIDSVDGKLCTSALCLMTLTLKSTEAAHRAISIRYQSGYYISTFTKVPSVIGHLGEWTTHEIRMIDWVLQEIPSFLKKLTTLTSILKYTNNTRISDKYIGLASSEGYMLLTTEALRTLLAARNVIFHELGHEFDYSKKNYFNEDHFHKISKFSEISEWKQIPNTNQYTHSGKEFTTNYAKDSPYEDFAESIADYYNNPFRLKAASPSKYDFIKSLNLDQKEVLPHDREPIFQTNCLDKIERFSKDANGDYLVYFRREDGVYYLPLLSYSAHCLASSNDQIPCSETRSALKEIELIQDRANIEIIDTIAVLSKIENGSFPFVEDMCANKKIFTLECVATEYASRFSERRRIELLTFTQFINPSNSFVLKAIPFLPPSSELIESCILAINGVSLKGSTKDVFYREVISETPTNYSYNSVAAAYKTKECISIIQSQVTQKNIKISENALTKAIELSDRKTAFDQLSTRIQEWKVLAQCSSPQDSNPICLQNSISRWVKNQNFNNPDAVIKKLIRWIKNT